MKKQKFIKKAVIATMLFSTMILPSVQTTTALADTFNSTAINDVQIKNNVSTITVNFLDPNGNKIGQITKDHVLIGKNFKTVNKYMYDNWEILNAEQTGVLQEGGTTLDITLKPNKTHKLTIQYVFENGQIVQTESLELPHGSKILINPKNAEGYELLSDSKELVVSSNDYVRFVYKSTAENQEKFNVEKAEVIDKGFGLSNITLENGDTYDEVDSFVDIVPEDYNYQYTDTFNAINNDPILRNISYSKALMDGLNTADAYKHLYYYAKAKDLMTFDEYFGADVTGITPNKKVVDLDEILEVHGLNPDEILTDASFSIKTIVNGEQSLDDFSKIEDAKYLLGMVNAPIASVENLGDYIDYEFNNVHNDIVVTYDVPLSIPKYFPDMLLKQYPRIKEEIVKNLEGKRVPLYDGGGEIWGSFQQNLSAFGDIYKKDGQFRIKVYMVGYSLNSGKNYGLDYIGGLKIDLNSQITVNYVNEKGGILDTTTEIIAKDTNYNISNKKFEGYELKDSNDKDKVVFVNKDMVVNIEYKPLETTPQVETGKVIVNYLDENGNKIIDSKEFADNVGNDFTVNAESLDGYELISDKVITGKVTKEDTIINFNYKKEKEVPVEPEKPVEPQEPTTEPEKPVEAPEEPLYQTNANKPNKNLVITNLVVFTTAILGTAVSILKKDKKG